MADYYSNKGGNNVADYYSKIIPADPFFVPEEERLKQTADYLLGALVAMEVTVHLSEAPEFIDCGGLLEAIRCPLCGAELDFDWWTGLMDERYGEKGFSDLTAVLPCCGRESSLDRLDYQAACGFARAEIRLLYPRRQPDDDCLAQAEALLGTPVRAIYSRI